MRKVALVVAFAALLVAGGALAQEGHSEPTAAEHGMPAEHGASGEQGAEHGGHVPGEINWFTGLIGESESSEPGLLWRKPGTPPPLGALLINTAILFYLLGRFGARPVADALKKRKSTIMQGMDDAQRMKREAADRLADYEDKLAHVDDEIERVKREMREAGEAERARILAEAEDKRARMERDAHLLIEHELKAVREQLLAETVHTAMDSARKSLEKQVSATDQQRLSEEYVKGLEQAVNARGGRA
ncbi:MAG: ATP synthase F0 subunit B [Myxococcales bacterium]|nr:ATP synthase F0 subunit B [Myxococcales bacterium]MCB9578967.1 ATP synthase F0 subunit B [Polyangiaceae bacterium]